MLIPAPSYVSYMPSVTFANGVPVAMECFEEDEFKLKPEAIEKAVTEKTKAMNNALKSNAINQMKPKIDAQLG